MKTDRMAQMVEGYLAGRASAARELPLVYAGLPAAFKHGWRNGRDDRVRMPRAGADVLRRRANMILGAATDAEVK